jgi:HEAT repeat protein
VLPATRVHVAPDLQYAAGAPIDEKLMLELAAAIENRDGSDFAVDYLAGLHTQGTAAVLKVYQRFSQSSSTALRAYGIAGLIREGNIQVLSTLAADVHAINAGASGDLIVNEVCQYSNANPAAVAALGALSGATTTVPRLQFCAAAALRRIHTKETLVYLQELLDSQYPDVRYEAVAGLASFANSGSIPREPPRVVDGAVVTRQPNIYKSSQTLENFPTVATFQQNEAKYIAFWKGWWTSVQPGLH